MRNVTGAPVTGEDLFGREFEVDELWRRLDRGDNLLMLAPRRVGKSSLMMELNRAPRERWIPFYCDVEAGDCAADLVAEIVAALASRAEFQTWTEQLPWVPGILSALKVAISAIQIESFRIDIKNAISTNWLEAAHRLEARLHDLPLRGNRLLFILDEFPILLDRILQTPDGRKEAEALLTWFRQVRLDPKLSSIRFLAGGSIGLDSVLRSHRLSTHVNDLAAFHVDSWTPAIAKAFLIKVGGDNGFVIPPTLIDYMLLLLQDPVPYHVQLLFDAVRMVCRNDVRELSEKSILAAFEDRLTGPSGVAHFDHYQARLEILLGSEELDLAQKILARACASESGVAVVEFDSAAPNMFLDVQRQLAENGYIREDNQRLRFVSGALRAYWRKYVGVRRAS